MNKFTQPQRGVIETLARHYHQEVRAPILGIVDFGPEAEQKLEDDYVDAVLEGLTDPDYWGN